MSEETRVTVDTSEADAELDQLRQHADMTAQAVMQGVQKGYTSLVLLADIMGIAIPEWFNLMAGAAMMTGQMFVELAAAETTTGILAIKAGATFAMAAMMFTRAMLIAQERTEVESRLNSVIMLLDRWS